MVCLNMGTRIRYNCFEVHFHCPEELYLENVPQLDMQMVNYRLNLSEYLFLTISLLSILTPKF